MASRVTGSRRRASRSSVAPRVRVELDTTYQAWKAAGLSTYTRAAAEELAADDDVDLVLLVRKGEAPPGFPPARTQVRHWWDHLVVRKGRIRFIPQPMRLTPVLGTSVVTVHDVIYLDHWTRFRRRLVFRLLIELVKMQHVGVVAVSHATRSRLLATGFDPRRVVVCQSSLPSVPPTTPTRPRCGGGGLVYVGNLRAHKGVTTLLAGYRQFAVARPGTILHVVTSATESEAAALLGDGTSTDETCCLHLGATDAERDAVLAHADLAITPSLEEGFGYAIDEALRLGTSVLASAIPAHIENGSGKDVRFFTAGDPDSLATELTAFYATDARDRDVVPRSPATGGPELMYQRRIPLGTALRTVASRHPADRASRAW